MGLGPRLSGAIHITYSDMAKLGKELVAVGALPENKLLDFIPLDPTQISLDGTVHVGNSAPVSMVEQQQNILSNINTFGGKGADYASMVLNMYRNSKPYTIMVDTR
jgi:hypothetical protein